MKLTHTTQWLGAIVCGLILTGFTVKSHAQPYTNYIVDQFDTDVNGWGDSGWGPPESYQFWDPANATTDMGPNNPGSGSMNVLIDWTSYTGAQALFQMGNFNNGDILNLNQYTNISFDVMYTNNSANDGAGSYGELEVGAIPTVDGWDSTTLGVYTSATNNGNGWIHVSIPLQTVVSTTPSLAAIEGMYFKIEQAKTGPNLSGISDFWIDNIVFGGNTNAQPKTTLSVSRVTTPPGLMLLNGGLGGLYTRELMLAMDVTNGTRNFSWVGVPNPVTYSQTIVQYPDVNHPMQDVIFLVQNANNEDAGIDYDAANVAQLSMYGQPDGTAIASFQFKTNQPSGNSQFTPNTLATLTAPSPLGTWSLTFQNNTNVTMSYVPLGGGTPLTTNFNFADETTVQTYFANPLSVFMGNQLNGTDDNVGQSTTYSEFKISGTTVSPSLDEIWTNQTSLDTTNWEQTTYPSDMLLVHPADKYWVSWTLPDNGLQLQANTDIANANGWSPVEAAVTSTVNGNMALLPGVSTNYPSGDTVFFDMVKTNAP